jgi:hypothetical protein
VPATSPWFTGSVVPLTWTNTDTSGNPQNAATVTVTVTLPDQTTATPTVENTGTGVYTADFTATEAGHHVILWVAQDPAYPGAWADSFEIQESADPTLVSLAEAKDILHLTDTTSEDLLLQGFNAAATDVAEHFCGALVTKQYTEVIRANGRALQLSHAPVRTDLGTVIDTTYQRNGATTNGLVSITPLLSYGFMYDLDQLICDSETGIVRHAAGFPFFYTPDYLPQYETIYWAGRAVIPAAAYQGARIVLEHLYMVKRGGTGAQDIAAGEDTTVVPGFGYAVPNRAIELFSTVDGANAGVFALWAGGSFPSHSARCSRRTCSASGSSRPRRYSRRTGRHAGTWRRTRAVSPGRRRRSARCCCRMTSR